MTPAEVKAELVALKAEMGSRANASASIDASPHRGRQNIFLHAYPHGYAGKSISVWADDWADGLRQLRAIWEEAAERLRAEHVRKMALAIIRITAEQGVCTNAALRADEFNDDDVERYGTAAVEDANGIAANGPFSITRLAGANAA